MREEQGGVPGVAIVIVGHFEALSSQIGQALLPVLYYSCFVFVGFSMFFGHPPKSSKARPPPQVYIPVRPPCLHECEAVKMTFVDAAERLVAGTDLPR